MGPAPLPCTRWPRGRGVGDVTVLKTSLKRWSKGALKRRSSLRGPSTQVSPLDAFFVFLQCQLAMEAREVRNQTVGPPCGGADFIWASFEKLALPNMG